MINAMLKLLAPEHPDHDKDGREYDLESIRAAASRCLDLPGEGILAVHLDADELHVSFAVFRWSSGPSTRDGVEVDGRKMELLFCGDGPSGNLRELRHTYWGDGSEGREGYLFDPPASLIVAAFAALREWFDIS